MYVRYLKVVFVVLIALLCLVYAGQNVANLEACYQSFAYVMSNAEHNIYPASFLQSITSPALIWLAVVVVVGCEFAAGVLSARGALAMWAARKADARVFRDAKKYALIGSGLGVVVWLGFFAVIGGAGFQMWQTAAGSASLEGAFQFSASCTLVFIILSSRDEQTA
jgi:predicted small integral membrane protein